MDKEVVVYIYKRILLGYKKNEMLSFGGNMDGLECKCEISHIEKYTNIWYNLYVESKSTAN